jgi:fluoroacetyl-CoA thioesterase
MPEIPIGARREERLLVTGENAIDFLGVEGARVLSTPQMIGQMERTCRNLALPLLDQGFDTVGTKVNISHLAAAPIGASVRFVAEVLSVVERRIEFHVEAWRGDALVGEGTHERTIINVAKFAARLAGQKAQG